MSPRSPKAGQKFTAGFSVVLDAMSSLLGPSDLSCTAQAGNASVPLVGKRLSRGASRGASPRTAITARCTWRLPRSSRGKRLSGAILVRLGDQHLRLPFQLRIR
jgi:hypothetical protein